MNISAIFTVFLFFFLLRFSNSQTIHLDLPEIRQPHPATCLPSSAIAVMQYFGSKVNYSELSTKVNLTTFGITFYELQQWLSSYGFLGVVCSLPPVHIVPLIKEGFPPVIAIDCHRKHSVVVMGYNPLDSIFSLMDPLHGQVQVSWSELEARQRLCAFQGMLIMPDTMQWEKQIIGLGLPVFTWIRQDKRYRSDALFLKSQQVNEPILQLALAACACETDLSNTDACFRYAELLVNLGFQAEAYKLLRQILTHDPGYTNAKILKQKLDKGK